MINIQLRTLCALVVCSTSGFSHSVARAASTTTYTYDALGRLTNASMTGTVNNGVQMSTTYDAHIFRRIDTYIRIDNFYAERESIC